MGLGRLWLPGFREFRAYLEHIVLRVLIVLYGLQGLGVLGLQGFRVRRGAAWGFSLLVALNESLGRFQVRTPEKKHLFLFYIIVFGDPR